MTPTPATTIGDLAAQCPQTIQVFRRLRVEFCCDGRRTLGDLCGDRQLSFGDLVSALNGAMIAPASQRQDWSTRPLSELAAHMIAGFHEPIRQELPRLHGMAVKVQRHSDSNQHVLAVVLYELERFNARFEPHMAVAENELFPLIDRLEAEQDREGDRARFDQLRATMTAEHAEAGHTLRILRNIMHRYEAVPPACTTLRSLYQGLKELDRLMQLHVHLENNLLFPRAAKLL